MKFFCDNCQAQYMISDEKVGPAGVRVRCKKCQHVIYVKRLEVDTSNDEKTVIAPPMVQPSPSPVPAQSTSASGIFMSETPAEEQKFEAEIGQALDSVFAENGAPPASASDSESNQLEQAPADDGGSQQDSADEPAESSSPALRSNPGLQPAAAPSAVEWYIAVRDEQVGPLGVDEIKSRFERGEVGSDTLVWSAGLSDWRPLSTVQELAQMIVPRATVTRSGSEATISNPRGEMPREAPAARKDSPSFKPSAASALASLASMAQEEIAAAARSTPAPPPAAWSPSTIPAPAPQRAELPDVPVVAAPAPAPVAHSNGSAAYVPAERPSYAAYAAPRAHIAWQRVAAIGAAVTLLLGGAMALAFWLLVIKPQREQAAKFEKDFAAQLAARPKEPAKDSDRPATPPAPTAPLPAEAKPPPSPAPEAAVPPTKPGPSSAPSPAAGKTVAAAEDHHGKGHKAAASKPTPAATDAPAAPAAKPAASSNSEDFLAGAGDSAIDKEFARELDGAGASEGGGKKASAKHAPYIPPPPGQADLPQQLSQSDVIGVVAQHKDAFGHCVQEQKKRDPTSSGTVVMHWKIKPDGHTSDVAAAPGDYQDSPLASCFRGQIVKMKFGQYRGAPMAPIQFPFNF
jgi:predicted Zn finger-like uncharacterized protein